MECLLDPPVTLARPHRSRYQGGVSVLLAWIASLFELDATLATRIAAGDEAALRRLYDRLAPRIRAVALRVLGSGAEADDAVQETFVEVWNRASTFDPERGSLVAWVTTIGHRRAVDQLRRRATRREPGDAGDAAARTPSTSTSPHESAAQRQARERIQRALEALPRDQREAIELMYWQGLSQREAAAQLDQPLGTLKSRVRAGMARLGALLDELAADTEVQP